MSERAELRRRKRSRGFLRGDMVRHKHRGVGIFEHYAADDESCFVRFEDEDESEKVTTSFLKAVDP